MTKNQAYIRRQLRAHLPAQTNREWEAREIQLGRALTREEIRRDYGWWGTRGHTYSDERKCECQKTR